MPVDVYLAPASPPCRAVLMTAKCIGLEVNQKLVNTAAKEQFKPEYLKMNPQHTIPTIDDNGFYLWESRPIQMYLANKYAPDHPIYPKNPKERALIDRMLYFDVGTLYKAEFEYMSPLILKGKPVDPDKKEGFETGLAYLEGFLENTPYVAGDHLTLADLSILASLSFAEVADFSYYDYPNICNWLMKMKSEVPSYSEINDIPLQQYKEYLKHRGQV